MVKNQAIARGVTRVAVHRDPVAEYCRNKKSGVNEEMWSINRYGTSLALALAVVLPATAGVAAAAGKKPEKVTIATGNQGTPWSVVGAAISQVIAKEGVKSNTELGGGLSNVVTVSNNRTNTGFTMAAVLPMAYAGEKPFPGKIDNVRSIGSFMINTTHVLVRKDAGVKSFADLKGKAFATQPVGNVTTVAFELLLQANGLSDQDVKLSRGGQEFGANQLKDRKVVGFTATTGVPSAAFIDAAQTIDVGFLPVSDEALKKVQKLNDGFVRGFIPAGSYAGQTAAIPTIITQSMLITNTKVSDDEAYFITKTIIEGLDVIKKSHGSVKDLSAAEMAVTPAIELHPGAKRYYAEKGYLKK
jgi:TRAP transporter TAXI family solute receptor